MLRTNRDRLVKMATIGEVAPPTIKDGGYRIGSGGEPFTPIGMAGIIYNAKVGDSAFGWEADHLEPGVKVAHANGEVDYAMHYLTCVGNDAVVASGPAKGARGTVTGEHARLIVDFPDEVLEQLAHGDLVQIESWGLGLALTDYPEIRVWKCDPRLLDGMNIREAGDGVLEVGVTGIFPSWAMGSGWELNPEYVDQDFMSNDREAVKQLGMEKLRIGDLVAIMDTDHRFGRGYKKGGVFIGLVNHGDSWLIGHGPGCMTILASAEGKIRPFIDPEANIANILRCGRGR